MDGSINNDDLLNLAENLIKSYASAKLVITSRIHSALPCLGLNTPVIFIANKEVISDNGKFNTPGRLEGLVEFLRVLKLEDEDFSSDDDLLGDGRIIDENFTFKNKTDWQPYAEDLARRVSQFMSD